jgi:aldehyde:ferredoxin oxidoreductase
VSNTILAVDIGSMNIKAVIAEIDEFNEIKVLGHGFAKSQGVKKGIITNIDLASKAIRKAVNDARRIAGNNVTSAIVSTEVPPTCSAIGPNNKLVFAPGLLGGTNCANSGRISVGAKSPLTGTIKEANSGGQPGQYLAKL